MKAFISITDPKDIADTKHPLSRTLYLHGRLEPNYPVPAIPLQAVFDGYPDVVYIDDLRNGEDDPWMICSWDFYRGSRVYTHYSDAFGHGHEVEEYF